MTLLGATLSSSPFKTMDTNTSPITSKICSGCKQLKQTSEFSKNKYSSNGYRAKCKNCIQVYKRQNAEKIAAQNAIYHKKHYEQNRAAILAKQQEHYCKNKDKINLRDKEMYQRNRGTMHQALRHLFCNAKARAQKNNLPFDLTIEWLETMVASHCPITLQPLDWLKEQVVNGTASPNSPSIDKIKPELGYVQSNCAIISHRGNAIKSNGTIDEHRRVVQYMAAQQLRDTEF
jgi:hypothetical protein